MALHFDASRPDPALVRLPWSTPLAEWTDEFVVPLPRGLSRHIVRIVRLSEHMYAIKETQEEIAFREYRLLRDLQRLGLPAVKPVGVVTGIVGYARGELVLNGRAGHAGTTPMIGREDALVAAAGEIQRVRGAALEIPGAVATVGMLEVEPGGANVIPSRVRLSLDVRAPDVERLDAVVASIGFAPTYRVEAARFSGDAPKALRDAVEARGLPLVELASGAGHDAGILATAGVDAGMLFVRSLNGGISHSPDELTSAEDVELAVDVLARALVRLAD